MITISFALYDVLAFQSVISFIVGLNSSQFAFSTLSNSVPLVCFIVHLYIFLSLAHKSPTIYPVLAFQSSMTILYPLISCQLAISAVNVVEVWALLHWYILLLAKTTIPTG